MQVNLQLQIFLKLRVYCIYKSRVQKRFLRFLELFSEFYVYHTVQDGTEKETFNMQLNFVFSAFSIANIQLCSQRYITNYIKADMTLNICGYFKYLKFFFLQVHFAGALHLSMSDFQSTNYKRKFSQKKKKIYIQQLSQPGWWWIGNCLL